MFPTPDSDGVREGEVLADRVEALAAWLQEIDARLGAAEVATGDEKTAKELRKAVEAVAKHDPKLEDRLTNRVDVLKDRIATLAEIVSTTSAGLAAKDGEIVGLRRALEAEQARVEALAADLRKGSGGGDVEELRKAVAAISAERRPRSRGDHGEGVPGKLDIIEQRLDTLAKTVATTAAGLASKDGDFAALRRQLDDESAEVEATLAEVRASVDPAPVAELRLTVKELAERTGAVGREHHRSLDAITGKVDMLKGQLDSLAGTAAATANGLASGTQELAALQAAFVEESGRLDSHVTSIEQVLGGLTPQLERLGDLAGRASVDALEQRTQGLTEAIEALTGRLDTLGAAVDDTGRGYAERELELAALSRLFEEGRGQVDSLVGDLRGALVEAGAGHSQLESRLEDLAGQMDGLGRRLLELDATSAAAFEQVSGTRAELAQGLEQVAGRIEAVERERAASSEEVARALQASAEQHDTLRAGSRLLEERVSGFSEAVESISSRHDQERSALEALVSQLRSEVQALAQAGPGAELESRLEDLAGQMDGLGRRLLELDATSAAAFEQVSGTRAELAQGLEQVAGRIEAVERERAASSEEVARALQASAEQHDTLRAGSRLLEERVSGFSEAVESISSRLESLASAVELAGQSDGERKLELAALSRRFEEGSAQVDSLIGALRESIETMPAPGPDPAHDARLEALEREVEVQAATVAAAAGGLADGERALAVLRAHVAEREHELESVAADLRSATDALAGRLDGLGASVEAVSAVHAEKGLELADLGNRFEQASGRVDALVGELRQALETMPAPGPDPAFEDRFGLLAQRVDELGAKLESQVSREETDRLLGKLLLRIDSIEDRQESTATELARASANPVSSEDEVAELRLQLGDLRARLASNEEELATLGGPHLVTRLDDVARRLDELEEADDPVVVPPAEAAAGDGRFRLELRGLELRMEHAEAAARENREAVLTQLERLASRVELRLQRLEPEPPRQPEQPEQPDAGEASRAQAAEGGARVVPIRGSEV